MMAVGRVGMDGSGLLMRKRDAAASLLIERSIYNPCSTKEIPWSVNKTLIFTNYISIKYLIVQMVSASHFANKSPLL